MLACTQKLYYKHLHPLQASEYQKTFILEFFLVPLIEPDSSWFVTSRDRLLKKPVSWTLVFLRPLTDRQRA